MSRPQLFISLMVLLFTLCGNEAFASYSERKLTFCQRATLALKVAATKLRSEHYIAYKAFEWADSPYIDYRNASFDLLRHLRLDRIDLEAKLNRFRTELFLKARDGIVLQAAWLWAGNVPPPNTLVDSGYFRPGYYSSDHATERLTHSDLFLRDVLMVPDLTNTYDEGKSKAWYEDYAPRLTRKEASTLLAFIVGGNIEGVNQWSFRTALEPHPDYEFTAEIDLQRMRFSKIPRALYLLKLWERAQPNETVSMSRVAVSGLLGDILVAEPRHSVFIDSRYAKKFSQEIGESLSRYSRQDLEGLIHLRLNSPKPLNFDPWSNREIDYLPGTRKFFKEIGEWISFVEIFKDKSVDPALIAKWKEWMGEE